MEWSDDVCIAGSVPSSTDTGSTAVSSAIWTEEDSRQTGAAETSAGGNFDW